MRYAVDPRQTVLFDLDQCMFSPMAIKMLADDWPAVFRKQILHLMPVGKLADHFHPTLGCPTKELYGMAGAIFLKEVFNLSIEKTVERYVLDLSWQYALNVTPNQASLSHASVERYMKLFVRDDLAADIFHRVAAALIQALDLDIRRQRLDSTHVFSDMATLGRTRLMGVAVKRFLVQLRRHHRDLYDVLPQPILHRYARSQSQMFADHTGPKDALRQSVAEHLLLLVERFADHPQIASRSTYKDMQRVLSEQCEVAVDSVRLKKETSSQVMQNPSDPDATYDGHKGVGYQAQLAETCSQDNDVQLITGADVEPAHAHDQDALVPMLDQLGQHDLLPDTMFADTHFGRDENVVAAQARGVDLQSPVGGTAPQNPQDLTVDDFAIDEQTEVVERCPNGHVPLSSIHDPQTGTTVTVMAEQACQRCPFLAQCPVTRRRRGYVLTHSAVQRRSAARRAEQATDEFREGYRIRAGEESLNSGLKRRMGMGRLRTRGLCRMRMGVLLRCAGWNLLQAARALRRRARAAAASLAAAFASIRRCKDRAHALIMTFRPAILPLRRSAAPAAVRFAAA